MKKRRGILFAAAVLVCSLAVSFTSLAGWERERSKNEENLINSQTWEASEVKEVRISYVADDIYIIPSDTQDIVLNEYLSQEDASYKAKTGVKNQVLTIVGGKRPAGQNVSYDSHIELIVPNGFEGELVVSAISGSIYVSEFTGKLQFETASGDIEVKGFTGKGSFETKSGDMDLQFRQGVGSVTANSASGDITADIQSEAVFQIQVKTASGTITNLFSDRWNRTKNGLSGSWGSNPASRIDITTASGDVELRQYKATVIPVAFEEMKENQVIWLGEYEFFEGKRMLYNVAAESGESMEVGLADIKDNSLNVRYYAVTNTRTNGRLNIHTDICFHETLKPAGRYRLYIRTTAAGGLRSVAGEITLMEYVK